MPDLNVYASGFRFNEPAGQFEFKPNLWNYRPPPIRPEQRGSAEDYVRAFHRALEIAHHDGRKA